MRKTLLLNSILFSLTSISSISTRESKISLPIDLFFSIIGKNLVMSGLKKAETGNALILRIYNPSAKAEPGRITFFKKVKKASLVTMEEKPIRNGNLKINGNTIGIVVPAKKIMTLSIMV